MRTSGGNIRVKTTRTKPSGAPRRAEIDIYLAAKQHPLAAEIDALRAWILGVDDSIREEIKWNSVSFRNEHDFFATVHLRSTGSLQLVMFTGVKKKATAQTGVQVDDPKQLIEKWAAKDRCVLDLGKGTAFKANRAALTKLVKAWIAFVGPAS